MGQTWQCVWERRKHFVVEERPGNAASPIIWEISGNTLWERYGIIAFVRALGNPPGNRGRIPKKQTKKRQYDHGKYLWLRHSYPVFKTWVWRTVPFVFLCTKVSGRLGCKLHLVFSLVSQDYASAPAVIELYRFCHSQPYIIMFLFLTFLTKVFASVKMERAFESLAQDFDFARSAFTVRVVIVCLGQGYGRCLSAIPTDQTI